MAFRRKYKRTFNRARKVFGGFKKFFRRPKRARVSTYRGRRA